MRVLELLTAYSQVTQTKKLDNFMHSSETIVFASHSESLLNSFCQRGIVLQSGVINFDGPIKEALDFITKEKISQNLSN